MRQAIFFALSVWILVAVAQAYTEISTCSVLNSNGEYYKLTANINDNNASCMNITADNVILDCAGNTIDGDATVIWNAGINATNVNGVTVANCTIQQFSSSVKLTNSNLIVLNSTYETESVTSGDLTRRWVITVNVTENPPVSGATVTLTNRTGDTYDTGATDSNGLARFEVTEYKNNSGTVNRWTNYTAQVSKSGYTTNSTSFNFTSNQVVSITLNSAPSSPTSGGGNHHELELRPDKRTVRASPGAHIEFIVTVRNRGDYDEPDILVYIGGLPEGWISTNETIDLDEDEEKTVTLLIEIPASASDRHNMDIRLRNDENRDRERITIDVRPCRADVDCLGMSCEQGVCLSGECECGVIESGVCVPYECCDDSDCGSSEKCIGHKCTIVQPPAPEPVEPTEPEPEVEPTEPEQLPEQDASGEPSEEGVGEEETPSPGISTLPPVPKPKGEDYSSIILLLLAIVAIFALVLISRPNKKVIRRIKKRIPRPRKKYAIEGPPHDEHQQEI